ncbi:NACHT domain-containing protein [Streptomyces sp. NPDC002668]|uniref:NACHT domain-containing protein n=1 Tax=Streptomyces sp. NPDC002668 TaxID=3154422 RepID=UPI00332AAE56
MYLRQLRENVRDMETVGVATQGEFVLRMRQVYVDVSLAPQVLHAADGEPYLGTVPCDDVSTLGRRRSLESVLREAERNTAARVLAVIGGPGSGKTTLARNTALALCEHRWRPWGRRLPVLLYLRDHAMSLLADEAPTLAKVAVASGWLEGKVSADWLEHRLDSGGCVVLLDGLDEVADPAERSRVVAWVARQTERHPRNVYVVTSRPHGYQSNPLPGAEVLQVRRFTGEQIARFLHRWSYAIESRARARTRHEVRAAADGLLARLRARASSGREVRAAGDRNAEDLLARLRGQSALYDLAANPLLLTMIANVHRYRGQLPGSRAELYAEMCEVLLHRRYEARNLSDATGLSGPHKQHVVQHLALAMMQAKVRDWPVHDAARAIHSPLQQVPGNVTPEVFLKEARKSGLLVEHEHGFLGFAHLTLQEYLAAAQLGTPRADATVLTGNVDDLWWRETILLWAAGNDATDVIRACLDCGTIRSLALAFDCADQAQIVDPAVRSELEALLTSPVLGHATDPALQRLLAGVLATRTLRDAIQINEGTALCTRPVPRALYNMFIQEEQSIGRHHPDAVHTGSGNDSSDAAIGMQAGDAERFVGWLNGITSDNIYRLPASEELTEHAAAIASHLRHHTVWAQDGTRTLLHQPPQVPWPYAPVTVSTRSRSTLTRPRSTPSDDRQQISMYLDFLAAPLEQRRQIADWTRVLATALTRTPEAYDGLYPAPRILGLDLALADAVIPAPVYRTGAVPRHIALARARNLHRARRLADALNCDRFHDRADTSGLRYIDRALALDPALDRFRSPESTHALDRARALADALTQAFSHTCNHAAALDHSGNRDLAETLARGRLLARAPNRDGPPTPMTRNLHLAEAIPNALASALDQRLAPHRSPEFDLDLNVVELPDALVLDVNLTDRLALAIDLALGFVAYDGLPKVAITAFRSLLASWTPPANADRHSALASLDGLLARTAPHLDHRLLEDPVNTIRHAHELLRTDPASPLGDQVLPPFESALELLTAIRDRRSRSNDLTLACARTGLLAATTALQEAGHPAVVQLAHKAWTSLAMHDYASPNQSMSNQILLLTRTLR